MTFKEVGATMELVRIESKEKQKQENQSIQSLPTFSPLSL